MSFFNNIVGRLRLLGILEGISFVLLVFVAMPLKYIGGKPEMVRIIGSIHGGLFVLLVLFAFYVGYEKNWKFSKVTLWVLLGSVLPFGPFVVDHKILKNLG